MTIAVFGSDGRVGSKVAAIAEARGHTVLPVEKGQAPLFDKQNADVVIDFSAADATDEVCSFCRSHRCPLVTGVTGRNETQQRAIDELSQQLPVTAKSNFAAGINALRAAVETLSRQLADWDCEIVEIHRKGKIDSPSGTAKMLAATAAKRKSFKGVTIHSLRCGSNFGCHSVIFATQGESLTLTHQAENTDIFAKGAVQTAERLAVEFAKNIPDGNRIGTVDFE